MVVKIVPLLQSQSCSDRMNKQRAVKIQKQGVSSARLRAAVLEMSPAVLPEKDPGALK